MAIQASRIRREIIGEATWRLYRKHSNSINVNTAQALIEEVVREAGAGFCRYYNGLTERSLTLLVNEVARAAQKNADSMK